MRADKLIAVLAKHEITHLTIGLDALLLVTMNRVPKSDAAIGSATARYQQSFLMRGPGQGFDSRLVTQKAPHRL